jgi:hypothetical protein
MADDESNEKEKNFFFHGCFGYGDCDENGCHYVGFGTDENERALMDLGTGMKMAGVDGFGTVMKMGGRLRIWRQG